MVRIDDGVLFLSGSLGGTWAARCFDFLCFGVNRVRVRRHNTMFLVINCFQDQLIDRFGSSTSITIPTCQFWRLNHSLHLCCSKVRLSGRSC
jgi:hypothetical protein